jgi:5-methylcytosine-specific restriction enzyme A
MKSNWPTESRHKRGYGNAWDKLRVQILKRDCGMCQCNQCMGIRLTASEVHHITSKAKAQALGWTQQQTDNPSNLQAVNSECHKRITLAEQGKTLKPRINIGLDGYPTYLKAGHA